jgi:glycosyltransferase involved in cell wall biosynthesis
MPSGFAKMEKIPLSVAIITKNEAHNLPDCLKTVSFADQIVIVDSGSIDETASIAKEFMTDFFVEEWKGFGVQKQSAVDKCRNEWILLLDADERIPSETADIIRSIVFDPQQEAVGYSFPRKNFFQGRWIKRMGWWPDRVVRLFRSGSGRMSEASVHEAVLIDGEVKALNSPIEHYTESRFSQLLLKINQYSTLGAQQAYAAGKRSSIAGAFLRAVLTFFQNYFLRLGLLDGASGLVLAVTDSINKFCKYAKLWELGRSGDRNKR